MRTAVAIFAPFLAAAGATVNAGRLAFLAAVAQPIAA
jgi:hypothetical protein